MAKKLSLAPNAGQTQINDNRIECDKLRGQYTRQGLAGFYTCVLSYSDGGQICRSAGDCIGQCRLSASNNLPQDGSAAPSGQCQQITVPFGCYATIDKDGRATPTLCVD